MQGPPLGWTFGALLSSRITLRIEAPMPIPLLFRLSGMKEENYFIRGLSAGRSLVRTREQQAWVALTLDLSRFQPGETSDPQMQFIGTA